MINRDYTKEVGLKPGTPRIPAPFAVALLALCAAGIGWGALTLHRLPAPRRGTTEVTVPHAPAAAAKAGMAVRAK